MKKQFMAMLDEVELDRLDALRIVMGVSRAEVNRQALTGQGLAPMERMHTDRLARLQSLADLAGASDWREYVRRAVAGRKVMPTLEVMEIEAEQARKASARKLTSKVSAA